MSENPINQGVTKRRDRVRFVRFVLYWNGNEIEWQAQFPEAGFSIEQVVEFVEKLNGGVSL